jgi:hypothetical protein
VRALWFAILDATDGPPVRSRANMECLLQSHVLRQGTERVVSWA